MAVSVRRGALAVWLALIAEPALAQIDRDRLQSVTDARFAIGRTVHELGTAVSLSPLDATYLTLRLMLVEPWGEQEDGVEGPAESPTARDNVLAVYTRYTVRGQDRLSAFAVVQGGAASGSDGLQAAVALGAEYVFGGIAGLGVAYVNEPGCGIGVDCGDTRDTTVLLRPAFPLLGVFTQVGFALADKEIPNLQLSYAPWDHRADYLGLTPLLEYRWGDADGHWLSIRDDAALHGQIDWTAQSLQSGLPLDVRWRLDSGAGSFFATGLTLFSVADHLVVRRGSKPASPPRRRGRRAQSRRREWHPPETRKIAGRPLQLVRFTGSTYDAGDRWVKGFAFRIDLMPGFGPTLPIWSLQGRLNHADDLHGLPSAEGVYFIGMWINFAFASAHGQPGDGWRLGFP